MGLGIVADEFPAILHCVDKEFLAIWAGRHGEEGHWASGKLKGCGRTPAKQTDAFAQRPNIGAAQEEVVASIHRPDAAAFLNRVVPSWAQRMKIAAIGPNLPERDGVGLRHCNVEANAGAVRGEGGNPGS